MSVTAALLRMNPPLLPPAGSSGGPSGGASGGANGEAHGGAGEGAVEGSEGGSAPSASKVHELTPDWLRKWLGLAPREWAVVAGIMAGLQDSEIAKNLKMAKCTVRTHIKNISIKLTLSGRPCPCKRHAIMALVFGELRQGQ